MEDSYPLYIGHPDRSVVYCISSSERFDEYKRLGGEGGSYLHTQVNAKDYFERLYIQDLIEHVRSGQLNEISREDFNEITKKTL